jgi:hypothetical protein
VADNDSVLRAARDVTLIQAGHELVVISHEPSTVGEALTIEMIAGNQMARVAVRVEDSRPIVVAGGVRHRIRLSRVQAAEPAI